MTVSKTPLSLVCFFFLFTFVASQSLNVGVSLGDKGCLIALDILGPGSSCGDRLRNRCFKCRGNFKKYSDGNSSYKFSNCFR
ncbi:hypothetical protein MKX03_002918 [Papaver bracteatum]|nr:hypothetical protein MKX03_002918 [Papaver bracteatum]